MKSVILVYHKLESVGPVQQKINPYSANPTKCSDTLKQFVGFCRQIV